MPIRCHLTSLIFLREVHKAAEGDVWDDYRLYEKDKDVLVSLAGICCWYVKGRGTNSLSDPGC